MPTGALTEYLDVAQVVLYAFWIFFALLILYIRQEDKREGYPLETERRGGRVIVQGFPPIPKPKTFHLPHGGITLAPRPEAFDTDLPARRDWSGPGSPLVPTGNPLVDAIGPASACARADEPLKTWWDRPQTFPLRSDNSFTISDHDMDPRGFAVVSADGQPVGTVSDLWGDYVQRFVRYVEVQMDWPEGAPGRQLVMPIFYIRFDTDRRRAVIDALSAAQLAEAPRLKEPDVITALEEERINAYFAGGLLYATPQRQEPLL